MAWANTGREFVARLTRHLPPKGVIRSNWRRLNRVLLNAGAEHSALVEMKSGVRLRLDMRAHSQVDAYYSGSYEGESVAAVLQIYDSDQICLDVGANVGFYATVLAQKIRRAGGKGRVMCFEPFPENVRLLSENITLNGLMEHCALVPLGLSDQESTLNLVLREDFQNGASSGNASIAISDTMDHGFSTTPIHVVSLDDYWRREGIPGNISLVKVDIEGHEDSFIQGAKDVLEQHRPFIILEVNRGYTDAKQIDLDQSIKSHLPKNYRIFRPLKSRWVEVPTFAECGEYENVFLVPDEKIGIPPFSLLPQSVAVA
jgi:FkbM family methyltransferase